MQRLRYAILWLSYACFGVQLGHSDAYSQVATISSDHNEGPKIFKALNMDLIYPKTFNSSENSIRTVQTVAAPPATISANYPPTQQQQLEPAKIAISYVTPSNDAQKEAPAQVTPIPMQPPDEDETPTLPQQQQVQQWTQLKEAQQAIEQEAAQPPQQQFVPTGRAVDYRPAYPHHVGQLITPPIKYAPQPAAQRPAYGHPQAQPYYAKRPPAPGARPQTQSTSSYGRFAYPGAYRQTAQRQRWPNRAEIDKLGAQPAAQISDRYTPGEAVATALFGKKQKAQRLQQQLNQLRPIGGGGKGGKVAASSNVVQSYVPPKNLYSFPPNINAKYPGPAEDPKAAVPTSSVNSYLAPPSGPLTNTAGYPSNNGYKYAGPVNLDYLPPPTKVMKEKPKDDMKEADDGAADDDTIGVLPASAMDADAGSMEPAAGGDEMKAMPDMPDMPDAMDTSGGDAHDHHHHDHDHPAPYEDDKEYPTPPPGWLEDHPDAAHDPPADHDHDHHHFDFHHDHFPSYPLIYDHDHDHHHHPPETPPPATAAPEPIPPAEPIPEAPEQPRVKKYSYFYIGRKLWYIPLYFTVWFSFYVLWLIIKSIARHKVNLPNHYVNRRSLPDYSEGKSEEYINQLTVSVLEKLEGFNKKYLT